MHDHSEKARKFIAIVTYHKDPSFDGEETKTYQEAASFEAETPIREVFENFLPSSATILNLSLFPDKNEMPSYQEREAMDKKRELKRMRKIKGITKDEEGEMDDEIPF